MIEPNQINEQPLTPEEEIYRENILDHYREPHNAGILVEYHVKHRELNPMCGDEITVFIQLDHHDKVTAIKFDGHGCAISQASMSMLSDEIKGKSLDQIMKMAKTDILKMLGIPIGIVRMKCALLSLKVVQNGIEASRKQKTKS